METQTLTAPKLKEGVVTVVSYKLARHPEYIEIAYCVDTVSLYDYILLRISDYIDGVVEIYEYRLIGDPDLFGTVVKWTPEEGWTEGDRKQHTFYDIRDCYSIVCQYRDNDWKLVTTED